MKWLLLICLFAFPAIVGAQTVQCPPDMVCISREAAMKALENADRVKALEAELAVKSKAIDDLKILLADMRVQYAECRGESTILKQRAVSDAAMIELLSKLVRPKKIGIFNF